MLKAVSPIRKEANNAREVKEYLDFSLREYAWPLAFLLSATMIGLNFPLGYIFILVVFLNRWKNDRYDFIIQFTLFSGGYSLLLPFNDLFFPYDKIVFFASIILMLIYKKTGIEKKVVYWMGGYTVFILFFAFLSEESIPVQYNSIVNWLSIFFFIIPLVSFSKQKFELKTFLRKLFPYFFILCGYYIVDGLILSGNFFLPRDASALFYGHWTTFVHFNIHPLSLRLFRVWPQGLYISILCIYALGRYFKLRWWQIIIFVLALFVCRTFTFYIALIVTWVVAMPGTKKKLIYFGVGVAAITCLYFIDSEPVEGKEGGLQSTFRIKSSVQQFEILFKAEDEEDLSKFGSNRMIVVIPALEVLYELNKQWIGVGFLSDRAITKSKFIISNESLEDADMREQVMTRIEIVPIQVFLTVGWIGLFLHCALFWFLWRIVHKLRGSSFFGTTLVGFIVLGLGGFSGLVYFQGLYLCGLSLAAVLLENRDQSNSDSKKSLHRSTDRLVVQ